MRAPTPPGARLLPWIVAALFVSSCGGSDSSPTTPSSSAPSAPSTGSGSGSSSSATVTGVEKVGWDQVADTASQLSHYQYVAFVDDAPQVLANAACGTAATNGAFACTASLPKMTLGSHRLEIATEEIDGARRMSVRSPVLLLNVVATKALAAAGQLSRGVITFDGIQLVAETVVTRLSAPSALAAAADGRIFIANRTGSVVVWQNGKMLAAP